MTINPKGISDLLKKVLSDYKTMLSYCLKCRKKSENKNPECVQKPTRLIMSSYNAVCGSEKSKFIKEQEACILLNMTLCLKYIYNNPDLFIVLVDLLLKIKNEYKSFEKKGDSKYIYQNEVDKACSQPGMA